MTGSAQRTVLLVFGTRPEAIKMVPVLEELRLRPHLRVLACSTGQHRELLDQALGAFGARCDIDLGLMRPGQDLNGLTARLLVALAEVLAREAPGLVLVHGDTTTALAAALAAFHAGIPVGHVEAGLRSGDMARPFPEEFNRVAVDAIAALLFAPTERAAANLLAEPAVRGRVLVTGNTGIDALLATARRLRAEPALAASVAARFPFLDDGRRLVLVTGHRRENVGAGLDRICEALAAIAARGDVDVAYPVHLNPEVRRIVRDRLSGDTRIHLLDPVDHLAMVWLMGRAALLLTDSGGLQEEGPALGKPVLVMRDVTERPEALATGLVRLVGTDPARIEAASADLLDGTAPLPGPAFPFGDGHAARRIADAVEAWFAGG